MVQRLRIDTCYEVFYEGVFIGIAQFFPAGENVWKIRSFGSFDMGELIDMPGQTFRPLVFSNMLHSRPQATGKGITLDAQQGKLWRRLLMEPASTPGYINYSLLRNLQSQASHPLQQNRRDVECLTKPSTNLEYLRYPPKSL